VHVGWPVDALQLLQKRMVITSVLKPCRSQPMHGLNRSGGNAVLYQVW